MSWHQTCENVNACAIGLSGDSIAGFDARCSHFYIRNNRDFRVLDDSAKRGGFRLREI